MVSPRNIRLALALLVISATIGIVAAIFQKGSKSAPPEQVSQQLPLNVDVALNKAHFTEVRGGVTVWTIVADRAEYSKKSETVHLFGIHMEFSRNHSAGTITVTAEKGTYSTKSNNVALRGKVHMTTASGIVFDTRSLDYLASPSRFKTTDMVSFRQQRMTLSAHGMDLDVDDQMATFHSAVEASVAGLNRK
ncbi:MAG: LPS export ABC transporter periplasmic protein LptC [Desulfuromonadales bacterium]|nr:LPS export ABC transporter periplasmic protein LptC [Desulfuromonadales bacterium]